MGKHTEIDEHAGIGNEPNLETVSSPRMKAIGLNEFLGVVELINIKRDEMKSGENHQTGSQTAVAYAQCLGAAEPCRHAEESWKRDRKLSREAEIEG